MAVPALFVSGDSHLEMDSKHWLDRVPAQYREHAPRVVRTDDGYDAWQVEDQPLRRNSSDLYGGKGRDVWTPVGQRYEDTPGTGPATQRVQEQIRDGVQAEVLYPAQVAGPRLWRSTKNDDAYRAVVQAYNDWLAEDYCSVAPERLLGVPVLPLIGLKDSIAEMERCAKLGFRTVGLQGFPSGFGYPVPEDDEFWTAALSLKMPVTVHVQLDRRGPGPIFRYPIESAAASGGPGGVVGQVSHEKFCRLGGVNAVQLIFSGVFDRFPELRLFFAENQIGWIAHFYEQADERYERHWYWGEQLLGLPRLERLPSEYLRDHIYWGFQSDRAGVELRHHLGVDRVIWASDFPHQESNWPESRRELQRMFHDIPDEDVKRMVYGNVVEFFHVDDYLPKWQAALAATAAV